MNCDPIVEETRQVRERLLAQFDGDLGKYVDHLIEEQAQDRDRLVTKEEVLRRKHEATHGIVLLVSEVSKPHGRTGASCVPIKSASGRYAVA